MWKSYAVTAVALLIVGGIGGRATDVGPWYRNLSKPSWNPPDWVFPVAWTTIYLFIIASVGGAWNEAAGAQRQMILWLAGFNFLVNMLWSILFFGMRKPHWALIDNVLLWLSIAAMIIGFATINSLYALLLVPYIAWVSVALLLNLSIVRLNPELAST